MKKLRKLRIKKSVKDKIKNELFMTLCVPCKKGDKIENKIDFLENIIVTFVAIIVFYGFLIGGFRLIHLAMAVFIVPLFLYSCYDSIKERQSR